MLLFANKILKSSTNFYVNVEVMISINIIYFETVIQITNYSQKCLNMISKGKT